MTAQTSIRAHKTSTSGQTGPRPRWLTYPEAAELCTLSVRSLKRLTAAGTLRCYVVGGKVLRLKASDVEALICRRTSTATGNGVAPPRRGRSEAARRQHSLFLTVVARPSLPTSVRLASWARVLGGRSRRARVDRSMQRHCVDLKWEADRPGTSPLRRVRVDRLGPGAGYAPRGNRGLSRRHFPKF